MMRLIGAHIGGGLSKSIQTANKYNINSIQMMPSAPMRWSAKEIPETQIETFIKNSAGTSVKEILLHGVYLTNLATGNPQFFHLGKLSLLSYLNCAHKMSEFAKKYNPELHIIGACFHPGSAKDMPVEDALKQVIEGMNWVLEQSTGGELLIEMTAGAGNVMGDTLEEVAAMREGIEQKSRVGYVIDTQHTFASGYDWIKDLDNTVDSIDKIIGIENVKAFHLNDSMYELGAHKDRHANLGEGKLGLDAITGIINHPKLKHIPFILETPNLKDELGIGKEMEVLRGIAKD
jgi:deoxyribonuclease-4